MSILLYSRVVLFFYFFVVAVISFHVRRKDGKYIFELTRLHHWVTIVIILLSFPLKSFTKLSKLHIALYSVNLPISVIIASIYWTLLYSTMDPMQLFVSITAHALVPCYSVFELICNRIKIPLWTILFAAIVGSLYILWSFVYHWITGDYVYEPMKYSPQKYIFYVGAPIACVVLTTANIYLHKLRDNFKTEISDVESIKTIQAV